jgi:hypothetical protein
MHIFTDLHATVDDLLDAKVSAVVLLPAEGVQVVALLAPVPETKILGVDLKRPEGILLKRGLGANLAPRRQLG